MKKALFILFLFITLSATASATKVSTAAKKAPRDQKAGVEFLLKYMPKGDRDTLSAEFLLAEVAWAYKARETFDWAKSLPDSLFFNDVLPYASMNEAREPWRERFWEMLYPIVKDETDVVKAIDKVTRALPKLTGVEYNTKRRRPHQSPSESIEIGMASCSGLSIILVDALRTIGVPARIAGTPLWVSKEGNHNWVEVNVDGKWYFTEYYPAERFNEGWFLERAGKADKSDPIYWIYATSWKPQSSPIHFPMVWAKDDRSVAGVDVTDFYIDLYNAQRAAAADGMPVAIKMYKTKDSEKTSADRVECDIRIYNQKGENVAAGRTKGATADMNDYLVIYLPENAEYAIEYIDAKGEKHRQPLQVGQNNQTTVELYFQ